MAWILGYDDRTPRGSHYNSDRGFRRYHSDVKFFDITKGKTAVFLLVVVLDAYWS